MMELVVVKVRPSYGDKKLHVLRFLITSSDDFSVGLINTKLINLFPYGFYKPTLERFIIDFFIERDLISSLCNHDYLAKYLISSEKLE